MTHATGPHDTTGSAHPGAPLPDAGDPAVTDPDEWRRNRREVRVTIVAFAVLMTLGIGVVLYSNFRERSYEPLDPGARRAIAAACDRAIADLEGLGKIPDVITRDEFAVRIEAENDIMRAMVVELDAVSTSDAEGQAALVGWRDDWRGAVAARDRYLTDVRDLSIERPDLTLPVARTGSLKPVTDRMEEYAQLHELGQCTPDALAVEAVEGPRRYGPAD